MFKSVRAKVLATVLIIGGTSAFLTAGTYALFTANTVSANNLFATGTLTMGNSNSASATVTLSNMIPGDTVTGTVNVQNTGSEDIAAYQLASAVTAPAIPNLLTTDSVNGLQVWVSRCSVAWTGSGPSATCGGTQSDVIGTSAAPLAIASGSPYSLAANAFCTSSASVTAAVRATRGTTCSLTGNDYLKVRISLPSTATNAFQGLSTTLSLTWQGTQTTAANF